MIGFTRYALERLTSARIIRDGENCKSLGGKDTTHIVARCLKRMCAWVKVVDGILRTEFPHFEVFQSFSIFTLAHSSRKLAIRDDASMQETMLAA